MINRLLLLLMFVGCCLQAQAQADSGNDLCAEIEKKKDDFTDELRFNSPIMNGLHTSRMTIFKYVAEDKATYYLSLRTVGSTVSVNKTGVIVLFEDGTKWMKDSEIDVKAGSDGFNYSAFITLKSADLKTFSTKKVKKFRLYIYDEDVDPVDAEKFMRYTECIRAAK